MLSVFWCLVSIMREKALSGMLATASRRDTGVEGTIRLKSVSDIGLMHHVFTQASVDREISCVKVFVYLIFCVI